TDRARLRHSTDCWYHRARRTWAELHSAVPQSDARRGRWIGACTRVVLHAGGLLPPGEVTASHRFSAAGLHWRQHAGHLSGRTVDQPDLCLARHPLDGPDYLRLAVGSHDGRCARSVDFRLAAPGEGAATARDGGAWT